MDDDCKLSESRSAYSVIALRRPTAGQRGNTLLMVMLMLGAAGVLTVAILSNLLGEIQGALSYRQTVQALSVAEAGVHYAAAKINESGGEAFPGASNQLVSHPAAGQIGLFDVTVRCSDGSVPGNPSPCAAAPQPNLRVITATGFVPGKAMVLGRRTVVVRLRQAILTSLNYAVCGINGVDLDQDTSTYGSVGSNGNITLLGPPKTPGSLARTYPFGGQAGDATAGGTVTCSGSCGSSYFQVAGTTTSNYPDQVCPMLPPITCRPGTTDYGVPTALTSLTISAANGNTAVRDVRMGSNSTLTFVTTGPNDTLIVQMNSLVVGQNSRVRVTGGGKVVLHMAGTMEVNQGTLYGVDGSDNDLAPGQFILESCASDPDPASAVYAVEFHQTGRINSIFFAPSGTVQLDQASLSRGAIQSLNVKFDLGTTFSYDTTSLAISAGPYNTLITWHEQP